MIRTESSLLLSLKIWTVPVFALLAIACDTEVVDRQTGLWRLIESDPPEIFQREILFETKIVHSWTFKQTADLEDWALNLDTSSYTLNQAGLHLNPTRQYTTLDLTTKIDATTLDAFEIRLQGLPRHSMTLQWRSEGQHYSRRREISVPLGRDGGNGYRQFRLAAGAHPKWKGTITGIRFAFIVPKGRKVVIDRVDAVLEEISETGLVDVLSRAWKIELDDDYRNSLLAPPEVPIDRLIQVPENGRLLFSYGLQETAPVPTRFEISVRGADDRLTILFEDSLETTGVWNDAAIDLSQYGGRQIELRFGTSTETYDPRLGFPVWANPETTVPSAEIMNVLFISIDTLRADHLSLYGYPRPTSPAIDRWASETGTVFENTIAAAPWTLPSHFSMFTGLNAHRHGVNHPDKASGHLTTLAERLQSAGYATVAITGGGFVHPQYGFSQGFDRYQTQGATMASEQELERGLASALTALETYRDRPFLLFFHTYEVHNPFRARSPFLKRLTGRTTDRTVDTEVIPRQAHNGYAERRSLQLVESTTDEVSDADIDPYTLAIDLYDSQIAYVDEKIGRLLETLDRLDLTSRTIVVLTSDHGELFGEHGLANHVTLYEANLRVPLILAMPGQPWGGQRIGRQVRSVDIMPTLLDLLDIPIPTDLDGISLIPLMEKGKQPDADASAISYAASSNYGISVRQGNRYKYQFRNNAWVSEDPVEYFFDLATDPGESTPVPELDTTAQRLRGSLLRQFAVESSGLRVLLSNVSGTEPLEGSLEGPGLHLGGPKALDVESAVLQRDSGSRAHFAIPPGQRAEIFFDGTSLPLDVTVQSGDTASEPISIRVEAETLDAVHAIVRTAEGPETVTMGEPLGDGVFVWWHGDRPQSTDLSRTVDPELRQQLEALGYVDN